MDQFSTFKLQHETRLSDDTAGNVTPVVSALPQELPETHRFSETERHHEKNGLLCGICHKRIIGSPSHLKRHALIHSGSAYPQVVNGQATYSSNAAENLLTKSTGHNLPPTVDLAFAQAMVLSRPAKIRHHGGVFKEGPLAGKFVAGYPEIFCSSNGRVKKGFEWFKPANIKPAFPRPSTTSANTTRRPRLANVRLAPPHKNTLWQDLAPTAFLDVVTNVWTPDKYPGWQAPPGWDMQWALDPTSIRQGETQCELCDNTFCDCITSKLSSVVPNIVDAGPVGQGIEATVPYRIGEYAGELIGELAPAGHHIDGWAAELVRNDLKDQGNWNVCQIYARYVGNWARMVKYSCEPNLSITMKPVSGKWRILLQVTKQIEPGDMMLMSYGDGYFSGGIKCLCGTDSCLERRKKEE